jgi:UDP-N-acetylglucosamine 2-epimerase (non-hydrolysing)
VILAVYGTRPEEIKLWPLRDEFYFVQVDQSPDLHQGLIEPAERISELELPGLFERDWDGVVVQGDTRTALKAALLAFEYHIPVYHVEAGLRTGNLRAPHPEEGNRAMIDAISTRLYCPTQEAFDNLGSYEQSRSIVTGQTAIDTLLAHAPAPTPGQTIVVTIHRNEARVEQLARGIATLKRRGEYNWRIFAHPNAKGQLVKHLLPTEPPLPYKEFVHVLAGCHAILTDSGGLQEEAAALGKPCLVMRPHTERPYPGLVVTEDVVAGFAELTPPITHPFGDGHAAEKIMEDISAYRVHRQPSLYL